MTAKARLVEIAWNTNQTQFNPVQDGANVTVQFNPETLKVTYTNQNRGGSQPGGGGGQFVGNSTSKLAVTLFFDTTETSMDVRRLVKQVAYFIEPKVPKGQSAGANTSPNRVPPGISFEWGTFFFRGVVDSLEENLEYFSEQGVPLRATVSLNITRQQIIFDINDKGELGKGKTATGEPPIGTEQVEAARQGDSVPSMAARQNRSGDWKSIAAANGIDDPLHLQAGAIVNLNAQAGASAGLSGGTGLTASPSASASGSVGASGGAGAQAGFSAGLGAGTGFGASAGASAGFGAGASAGFGAGASAGLGAGASAGFGGGGSVSTSAGISGGVSASPAFGAATSSGRSLKPVGPSVDASVLLEL